MLNYTNPMAMNCWAWYAGSSHQKIVGLCHSIQNTSHDVCRYAGVPFEEVTFLGAGVNHMSWVLRLERDGQSIYPLLDAAIAADPEGLGRHVRVQIYKLFGFFPTESSEHFAEYVPWFMRDDAEIDRLRIPVDEYVRRSEENLDIYAEEKRKLAAGEPFELERSGEYASLIIHSMVTGQPRTIYGNVRNTGLIANLPQDACVEVPCLVDRAGVQPTVVGISLPSAPHSTARSSTSWNSRSAAHSRSGATTSCRPSCSIPTRRRRSPWRRPRRSSTSCSRHTRPRCPTGSGDRAVSVAFDLLVVGDVNPDVILRARLASSRSNRPSSSAKERLSASADPPP